MKISGFLLPCALNNTQNTIFDIAIVIDVLRATTTLQFAAKACPKMIIPCATLDEARELHKTLPTALLCGEREGMLPDGFNLGNSPQEYTPEKVSGKILVFASTNGSGALIAARKIASRTITCCLRNTSAVASKLHELGAQNVAIICAGQNKRFSLEDTFCAGMLAQILTKKTPDIVLDDSISAARAIYTYFNTSIFNVATHAQYLQNSLGYDNDIYIASQIDADDFCLEYNGEQIFIMHTNIE